MSECVVRCVLKCFLKWMCLYEGICVCVLHTLRSFSGCWCVRRLGCDQGRTKHLQERGREGERER